MSGTKADRPGLARLLEQLQSGDVLTVWKPDRLGRSVSHLVALANQLGERSVQFRRLTEALDTTTPAGRLLFYLVAALAQFERELTVERTKAALEMAWRSNKKLGRPSRLTQRQYDLIHRMHRAGATHGVIASTVGLSRP